jgi:aryl-alcohol dehydrogenase-like predicted oxidoreductase
LDTRELGTTGFKISPVGFGAWAAGGGDYAFGWGAQDDDESIAAIRHAVELGINWVDTAPAYGVGHSEEVVGRAIRSLAEGDRPLVFTKCGLVWDEANPKAPAQRILQPVTIRKECEASLRRLGVGHIDLYQFHHPDDASGTPVEDAWAEMVRLVQEGKVRAIGVSNFDVSLMQRCETVRHVDSVQPPFSLIDRVSAAEILPWASEHRTGVIVYSPMQSGLLTDTFTAERACAFPPDDWRGTFSPEFKEPQLSRNLALRDALRPIAARLGVKVAAIAVGWTLSWPEVAGAIVGGRSASQVDGWAAAANLRLSDADLDETERAIMETKVGSGPSRPLARAQEE